MSKKIEPIKYYEVEGETVGCYYATISPDGWVNVYYQPEFGRQLDPEERLEFIQLVCHFIQQFKTREALEDFCVRYGKVITPGILPLYGILVADNLMAYDIKVMGCNVEFIPHRKRVAR